MPQKFGVIRFSPLWWEGRRTKGDKEPEELTEPAIQTSPQQQSQSPPAAKQTRERESIILGICIVTTFSPNNHWFPWLRYWRWRRSRSGSPEGAGHCREQVLNLKGETIFTVANKHLYSSFVEMAILEMPYNKVPVLFTAWQLWVFSEVRNSTKHILWFTYNVWGF